MSDLIYAATLLLSLAAGGGALGLALAGRLSVRLARPGLVRVLAMIAWASLVTSLVVHFVWGHPTGTPYALPPVAFLSEHVSFFVALALPAAAWLAAPHVARL